MSKHSKKSEKAAKLSKADRKAAKAAKQAAKAAKNALSPSRWTDDPRKVLRVGEGFQLASLNRAGTPGWDGDEEEAHAYTEAITPLLSELQERLYAASKDGSTRRVLVVAQGLDTAGKGGIARHVMALVDPQGVSLMAFKAPTEEEKSHDFLWRIWKAVPTAGKIGLFDRSHYEDILVPGVNGQLDDAAFDERVAQIHDFEKQLIEQGTAIIKVALMVSYEEQGLRLLERMDRPDKQWKYSTGDLDTRAKWFDFQGIYQRMLTATSFPQAPWYVVPADNKWYARLSVTEMLLRELAEMDIDWPAAKFDVATERERVRATVSAEALAEYDKKIGDKLRRVARHEAEHDATTEAISSAETPDRAAEEAAEDQRLADPLLAPTPATVDEGR
ncbi:PPK2 family polyphosphate kinase [Actinomyces trachealis]|uniref:PPK2 family polyphosphate kinase n=1 Tax=Actinomyces trachealis TaxID=2763540 RepID=UPI001892BF6C|nr:PPK2 family polyphosphate kinase [Actinomyces trachealis]